MDQKKISGKYFIAAVAFSLFLTLFVFCAMTFLWQAHQWDDLKMTEIVYQLFSPMEGAGQNILTGFFLWVGLPGLAALIISVILIRKFGRRRHFLRHGIILSLVGFILVLVIAFIQLNVGEFLRMNFDKSTYIEDNYVDAAQVDVTFPDEKRNLIYIWLESMETTYADTEHGGGFTENVIPELTALAEENTSFTGDIGGVNGALSLTGSTWTMGAMFAQAVGLPLKIPITENSMSWQKQFFPGVTAIGDILNDEGYRQVLLIGSDASFAGRRTFFQKHGNYDIRDYLYSTDNNELPPDYCVWWGYEDEKLFELAKKHLSELAQSDEPFNLSLLTVDTHFPDGYVCRLCDTTYSDDQYTNVIHCSDKQVADFVRWLKEQPFYDNTTVVITGDHITMDIGYCDDIAVDYQRRVYTTILNPVVKETNAAKYRVYTTMDLFPTTLAAMGVKIEGDRLGLGVNLFSDQETLAERDGVEELDTELKKRSTFMDQLSGFDDKLFRLSEELSACDTELTASFNDSGVAFTLYNLADYDDSFSDVEVFAEKMEGNVRAMITKKTAKKEGDGYTVSFSSSDLKDERRFVVNIYVVTDDGRLKVDTTYLCDLDAQTLTRQEE